MWAAIIGLGTLAMNWSMAKSAERQQQEYFNWQMEQTRQAIAAVRADQKLWDSIVPALQEKFLRFTTGTLTQGEQAARQAAVVQRAAPAITTGAAATNQQAAAAKSALTSSLGARGLSQHAPGVVGRGLSEIEAARVNATGVGTMQTMAAAGAAYDQNAIRGLSDSLNRYGQRPSLAPAYMGAAGSVRPPAGPAGVDASFLGDILGSGQFDEDMNKIWTGLGNLFKKPPQAV